MFGPTLPFITSYINFLWSKLVIVDSQSILTSTICFGTGPKGDWVSEGLRECGTRTLVECLPLKGYDILEAEL